MMDNKRSKDNSIEINDEKCTDQGTSQEKPEDLDYVPDAADDIKSWNLTPKALRQSYLFLKEIGKGAQARVYLAIRLSDQKYVTIKQLNIGSVKTWKAYDLFQREASVLEKLDIEGVAEFYEAIECLEDDPPCSYIVQEYIEGKSIARMMNEGHRFQIYEVYDIIIQLLHILKRLQAYNPPVIHRDIKPSNIMVSPRGGEGFKVTLIDFGAVANPQVKSGGSTVAGTYGYMPPEQLMGKPVPASDVYALGAVAVELFTGKTPDTLPNKDFRLIFEPEMEQMSPVLVGTLRKMLEPKVELRLSDIDSLIASFEQYREGVYTTEDNREVEDDFEGKLKKVTFVGESGNMDLWQSLSDQTPRYVPEMLLDRDGYSPAKTQPRVRLVKLTFPYFRIAVMAFLLILVWIVTVLPIAVKLLLTLCCIIVVAMKLASMNRDSEEPFEILDRRLNPVKMDTFKSILKWGRKTVATITDVEYVPVLSKNVIQIGRNKRESYIYYGIPDFIIRYKFNPPDDTKDEDLVHECIVHTEPEGHYRIGDPFPILYWINHSGFREQVLSMLFPYPLQGTRLEEIVSGSIGGLVEKHQPIQMDEKNITHLPMYNMNIKPIIKYYNENDIENLLHAIVIAKEVKSTVEYYLQIGKLLLEMDNWKVHAAYISGMINCIGQYNYSNSVYSHLENQQKLFMSFILRYFSTPGYKNVGDILGFFTYYFENLPVGFVEDIVFSALSDKENPHIVYYMVCGLKFFENDKKILIKCIRMFKDKLEMMSPEVINSLFVCKGDVNSEIWDAVEYVYSDCVLFVRKVLDDCRHGRSNCDTGIYSVDILEKDEYMPIHAYVAYGLLRYKPHEMIAYLSNLLKDKTFPSFGTMQGIVKWMDSLWLSNNDETSFQIWKLIIDFYRILTQPPMLVFYRDCYDSEFMTVHKIYPVPELVVCCIRCVPLKYARDIFKDDELKGIYPVVFTSWWFAKGGLDESEFFDLVKFYFSRDLSKDEELHVDVLKAVWKCISSKNELGEGYWKLFMDIAERGTERLSKVLGELCRGDYWANRSMPDYVREFFFTKGITPHPLPPAA